MKVRVRLFAVARELAGSHVLALELPDSATIADLQAELTARVPALAPIVPLSLWAIGAEYVDSPTILTENADVALIPPVSGG